MARDYIYENIRALLIEGFDESELRNFCHDTPQFKPVYGYGYTRKVELIHQLIEYAEQKELTKILLAWAKENNPAKYEQHMPYHPLTSAKESDMNLSEDFRGAVIGTFNLIEDGKVVTLGYDALILRRLVTTSLNDEELTSICYEYFPDIYNQFTFKTTYQEKIQLLIEYCEKNNLLDQLLAVIKNINPMNYTRFTYSLKIIRPQGDTEPPQTRDDYINEKLIEQNYVTLNDLEPIPESERPAALQSFKAKTTYDLIYNANKSCLMFRYWPRLKIVNQAWETLAGHLDNELDPFIAQWLTFASAFEAALGVGSVSAPQTAARYNRIIGYQINTGDAFAGLNLPHQLVFCTAQYPQPNLADLEGVYHLVKTQCHANIAVLVLFLDSNEVQKIQSDLDRRYKRSQACDIIVLTYAEVSSWLKSDKPLDELRRSVLRHVSLKAVSPFVINGPTPETMFFGRENELRRIRDHLAHQSFAITGGRRIGKTSIAQRLLANYLPAANFYALYQDVSFIANPEQFWAIPLSNWQPARPADAPATLGELLTAGSLDKPVALLLDEADKLVPVDRKLGWSVFNQLRAAANSGQLHLILIGERHLRESMQDSRSPLFNFTNDILIGRLNFENVEKLITQPLEKLEIIYDSRIVRRIYEFTSGHPNIVQRLCYQLIELLDKRNDRKLMLDDVETVANDPGFQRDDFLNTYLSQATVLERILTIILARSGQDLANLANLRQWLRQELQLDPSARELNAALQRLVDLRLILNHQPQGYSFAVPAIPLVINQSQALPTADLLEQYVEDYRLHGDLPLEEIESLELA